MPLALASDEELLRRKSFDALEISGVLYRPPATFRGPRPVIINVHGGPVDRERPRFLTTHCGWSSARLSPLQ